MLLIGILLFLLKATGIVIMNMSGIAAINTLKSKSAYGLDAESAAEFMDCETVLLVFEELIDTLCS